MAGPEGRGNNNNTRPLSQQLAPEELVFVSQTPAHFARDQLDRASLRHNPLPEKQQYPTLPRQPKQLLDSTMKTKSDSNGDLPTDQVIPLEELPKDQHPHYMAPPEKVVVDEQPLLSLRPPRKRRSDKKPDNKYDAKSSRNIGIVLIVIGICEIVMNSIGLALEELDRAPTSGNFIFYLAPGFWCSVFFILCGTFGVVSGRTRATWAIVTHLVVATLAGVFALILLAISSWKIYREVAFGDDMYLPSLILLCLMAFGALLAFPLALYASVLCCRVFCTKQTDDA